jgi:hypothetical protein
MTAALPRAPTPALPVSGRERGWLIAGALALAIAALGSGRLACLAVAPLAGWLALLATRPDWGPDSPRHWIGAGLASALAGAALFLMQPGFCAFAALAVGGVVLAKGVRASLRFDPPPQGLPAPKHGPALWAAVGADELLTLGWQAARRAQPRPDRTRIAADVRAAVDRNREHTSFELRERAYLAPPPLEKLDVTSVLLRGAGNAEHLRFASEFEAVDPEIRESFGKLQGNRTAHVHLWRSRAAPRPTLICLHGYRQGRAALDALAWDVRRLHTRLGLDVALFTLPLHGPRSQGWHSGAGFLDGHPLWTSAALAQAVWDLRRLSGWLRGQGAPMLGIAGFSLGGYAAALYASLEAGLASAVLLAPIVALDAFAWRLMPPAQRAETRASGLTEHLLQAAWHHHAPLALRPQVPHAARLVISGLADRLVPPLQAEALWEHWGRPAQHWYPGSHSVWLGKRALHARIEQHLRATLHGQHS